MFASTSKQRFHSSGSRLACTVALLLQGFDQYFVLNLQVFGTQLPRFRVFGRTGKSLWRCPHHSVIDAVAACEVAPQGYLAVSRKVADVLAAVPDLSLHSFQDEQPIQHLAEAGADFHFAVSLDFRTNEMMNPHSTGPSRGLGPAINSIDATPGDHLFEDSLDVPLAESSAYIDVIASALSNNHVSSTAQEIPSLSGRMDYYRLSVLRCALVEMLGAARFRYMRPEQPRAGQEEAELQTGHSLPSTSRSCSAISICAVLSGSMGDRTEFSFCSPSPDLLDLSTLQSVHLRSELRFIGSDASRIEFHRFSQRVVHAPTVSAIVEWHCDAVRSNLFQFAAFAIAVGALGVSVLSATAVGRIARRIQVGSLPRALVLLVFAVVISITSGSLLMFDRLGLLRLSLKSKAWLPLAGVLLVCVLWGLNEEVFFGQAPPKNGFEFATFIKAVVLVYTVPMNLLNTFLVSVGVTLFANVGFLVWHLMTSRSLSGGYWTDAALLAFISINVVHFALFRERLEKRAIFQKLALSVESRRCADAIHALIPADAVRAFLTSPMDFGLRRVDFAVMIMAGLLAFVCFNLNLQCSNISTTSP